MVLQLKKNGKKGEAMESFSFNFRLNAGIHGKSNIGVKGDSDNFAVLDLKSSVHSQQVVQGGEPDVSVDGVAFYIVDPEFSSEMATTGTI